MNRESRPTPQLDLPDDRPRTADPGPPPRRIDELFRAQATRTPDAPAVRFAGRVWTYAELERRTARIAARLAAAGAAPEQRVAVCLERGPSLVAALLGVLRSGAAYVPLDPAYPAERLAFMLADSGARLALAESATVGVVPDFDGEVLRLGDDGPDGPAPALPAAPAAAECTATERTNAGQLAYVIYTSGSTGRPKGVAIAHSAVAALLAWAGDVYSADELSGVMAATSVCFDLSVFELFLPLTTGGTVVMARDALELPRSVDAERVTLVNTVPSAINELLRGDGLPGSVATVNLAGEPLARPLVERLYAAGSVRRVLNLYGPSEDTTYSTWSEVERGAELPVTIGTPVRGTRTLVVDRGLRPVGVGVPGELLLGGAGLARGYLGRPGLTAERWVPDPFAAEGGEPGGRLYRTGDLVRRLDDGRLDFVGRIDHQVKVRGFRIELGEVETALLRRPAVSEAVAVVRGEAPEDRNLVAYWAPAGAAGTASDGGRVPTEGELKEALADGLPAYMVPTRILRLEALPRTLNGKVDRGRLPAPEAMRPEGAAPYRAPEGELESELAGWWAELLGLEKAGADDGLFELGGHSLVATQIAARVRQRYGVDLPPVEVFEYPTPATLAGRIEELASGDEAERPAIPASPTPPPLEPLPAEEKLAGGRKLPLSFPQEQIWLILQLAPQMLAYNFQFTIRLRGDLDRRALLRTLAEIIRRHEIYRTSFPEVDGEPVQRIHPPWVPPLPTVDLSALPPGRREAAGEQVVVRGVNRSFDVTELPLLEWTLVRFAAEDHMLLQVEQHFVHDGWSIAVFVHELTAIYDDFAAGRPPSLPAPPIQFADFAVWQRDWLSAEALERELDAWRGRLGDPPPPLELPTDRPRPRRQSFRGDRFDADLPPDLYAAVRAFGRRQGYTLFMTMLAAFEVLLYRYSGRERFLLGSGVANRRLRELEGLLGMVVNTLVLAADAGGRPTFRQVLSRARAEALFMQAHQDLPFEALVAELSPDRDLSRNPLFQHLFSFHDAPVPDIRMGGLEGELLERRNGSAKADWNVIVRPRAEQRVGRAASADDMLRILWEFSTDLYDRTTIGRAWGHYQQLLRGAIEHPERTVDELPLLTPAERDQIAAWGAAAVTPEWERPVAERVLAHAAADAGSVAVLDADGTALTYGDLARRAAHLAGRLGAAGVGPGGLVAVCLPASADLAVALLAARLAGAAYLPLDPDHPVDRRRYSLEDSRADALITTGRLAGELPEAVRERLAAVLDAAADPVADEGGVAGLEPPSKLPLHDAPEARAYVIYTSGTTGRPKGTELTQRGLANLVAWHLRAYPLAASDRVTLVASPAFDASVWELWPALVAGAAVCVPPPAVKAEPVRLARWLAERRITVSFLPTPLAEELLAVVATGGEAPPLRTLLTGGDRLHRVPEAIPFPVVNHYGPTEATVVTTAGTAEPGREGPPIGSPIDGFEVHVLDRSLRPVPAGVAGELWVAGAGLARGYLGRPALTAERFRPDPLSARPGTRMYGSGDLVRWLPSGELDFLGRADDQVQVRGVRVEPAEVEAVLEEHPGVRRAAVVTTPEGDRLAAFWLPAPAQETPPTAAELSAHAARSLPEAAVPGRFEALAELPLSATGKVDRRELSRRAADLGAPAGDRRRVAPRTALEGAVAEVLKEVVEVPEVGAHDDFFRDLGGHSLLAARTVARLRRTFGIELALAEIFDHPTPAEMAELVSARIGGAGDRAGEATGSVSPIQPADRTRPLPLSFGQERLWLVDRLIADRSTYTIARAWDLVGALDAGALRAAVADLARCHEALRTRFPEAGPGEGPEEGPVQRIAPPDEGPPVLLADLEALPTARCEAESERLAGVWARTPFDLGAGPLTRVALLRRGGGWQGDVRRGDAWHRLLLAQHHTISDAWSLRLLLAGIGRAYAARTEGRTPDLEPPAVQPADVAVWQRDRLGGDRLGGDRLESLLAWWRKALEGMPRRLDLPTDRPRPAVQRHRGARVVSRLPPAALAALDGLVRKAGATPFMTLLAAWAVVLARWARQSDVVVGSPVAARERPEMENLLGFFINTLALPVRLAGDGEGESAPCFIDILERVRTTSLGAFAHAELPFERLVDDLTESRDLSGSPLFQVTLALQNTGRTELTLPGVTVVPVSLDRREAHFDITLFAEELTGGEGGRGLELAWSYDRDLFDASTIERIAGHLATVLTAAAAEPGTPALELPLLTAEERRQVTAEYRAGDVGAARTPPRRIDELFRRQAASTPEAPALRFAGEVWSYAELDRRSDRIAARLLARGAAPEQRVAVCLQRTPALVAALLGVLKSGAAYVPLDPAYPAERLAFMLEDSGARLALAEAATADVLPRFGGEVVRLDDDGADDPQAAGAGEAGAAAPSGATPEQLAYVIYTSGSTGRPKGVAIPHAPVSALLAWAGEAFSSEELAGVLAATSVCFDLSVFELFAPLTSGGAVVLARDALELPRLADAERVTLVNTVPSAMTELLRDDGLPPSVITVDLAGEPLVRPLVERLYATGSVRRVLNLYGPSEDTTYSTWSEVEPGAGRPVTIGRPVTGSRALVVDGSLRPAGIGVPGELLLGGAGLARGYLGRPGLTAERWVPDPLCGEGAEPGARLYRTGDLVRRLDDGRLDFLGRIDHQVKVRGFRIELGEIETALLRRPAVGEAVAVVLGDAPEERRLVAYWASGEDGASGGDGDGAGGDGGGEESALAAALAAELPGYMVPGRIVRLDELPRTPNGKVDRGALPAPERAGERELVAPRTPSEERIAALWAEALGLETVGAEDDFFALGGNSLLANRLMARLRRELGADLHLRNLFLHPTVAALAAEVDRALAAAGDGPRPATAATTIRRVSRAGRRRSVEELSGGSSG